MIFYVIIAFNIAMSVLCTERQGTLPFVNPCKRDMPDYSACLKNTLEDFWPQLVEGLPEFNLPPLDPFLYDYSKVIINRGEIYGEVEIFNVTIIGMRKIHFLTFKSHIHDGKYRFDFDVKIPRLVIDGHADAVGSLGAIRMNGKGRFNVTVDNIKSTCYVTGHEENNTLVIEHFRIIPIVEKMKIHFDDYFEGNRELNDLLENFVNEFWPTLYRLLIPIACDVWDEWFTNFANRLLPQVSISQIFP